MSNIASIWADDRYIAILRSAFHGVMLKGDFFEDAHRIRLAQAATFSSDQDTIRIRRYEQMAEFTGAAQEAAWLELDQALETANIETLVIKGMFFHNVESERRSRRYSMHDVDLVIRAADHGRASDILQQLGYSQSFTISERLEKVERLPCESTREILLEAPHIKLVPVPATIENQGTADLTSPFVVASGVIQFGVAFELHVDAPPGMGADALWTDPQQFSVSGRRALAPSDTTMAWFLPFHFYLDVVRAEEKGMSLLLEFHRTIERRRVDWRAFSDVVSVYQWLKRPLAYVFDFYAAVVPQNIVPPKISELLHSVPPPFRENEPWYDYGEISQRLLNGGLTYQVC